MRIPIPLFYLLLSLLLHLPCSLSSQDEEYIGSYEASFNLGTAYQTADIPVWFRGWGLGLTLGKNFYARPEDWIAFDVRGRFLVAQSFGLDEKPFFGIASNEALNGMRSDGPDYSAPGFVYSNFRNTHFELGAEALFTFHQLRKKRFIVSALVGLGIHWHIARINQLDAQGNELTPFYEELSGFSSTKDVRKELRKELSRHSFETLADQFGDGSAKADLMPCLGLEIGYQLSPTLALTLGHRLSFSGTDLLDGQQWNADNSRSQDKDLFHFTSINIRWRSPGTGNLSTSQAGNNPKPDNGPLILPTRRSPQVSILAASSPETDSKGEGCQTELTARAEKIGRKQQLTLMVNDEIIENYSYNAKTGSIQADLKLEKGLNLIHLKGRNDYGEDSDQISVFCQPEKKVEKPSVSFIDPPDQSTTDRKRTSVSAEVNGVSGKQALSFRVNGRVVSSFSFSRNRPQFQAVTELREGENQLTLTAENESGVARDSLFILYSPPELPLPEIDILSVSEPSSNPFNPNIYKTTVIARIDHIQKASQITFLVNGVAEEDIVFDQSKREFQATATVNEGENILIIQAENESGRAEVSYLLDF
jgi:hypothetical protein